MWKRPFKKPLFNYYGGKFGELPQIMPLWPPDLSETNVYVPFGGALNEVRAIQTQCNSVTVVELSDSVANFHIQLKDHTDELISAIENLPPLVRVYINISDQYTSMKSNGKP